MAKSKEWTSSEIEYLTINYPKAETKNLAIEMGRSQSSISSKATKLGLFKEAGLAYQIHFKNGTTTLRVAHRPNTYAKERGIVYVKSLTGHPSLDCYRKVSQIYHMDLLLRSVGLNTDRRAA
ncbi:Uncharacterised protein [Serratia quinivorans]|uniref:hypothetical protein n=1 Tax=Serratia quinivorans TaxID=137545 RepID=UPI00217A16E9|nr:hypothetical protein [Serratia quinivorans]CAI1820282.1 Uncharacterised protein [Serratia quinivorans]